MEENYEASILPAANELTPGQYNESDEIARASEDMIEEASKDFKQFKEKNPEAENFNLRIIKAILKRLHTAISKINNINAIDRESHYYIVFNGTITIFEICRMLRLANFYRLAARYLTFNILSLDHNLLLTTGKYLSWRVKNYIE